MEYSLTCLTLQRVLLPLILAIACLLRPVGISFVYLLMFFVSPFIPIATTRNFRGSVAPYLIILITLSIILVLGHIALQVIVITLHPDHLGGSCEFSEQLLRHVGLIDFRNLIAIEIVKWLTPEVLVFLTSLSVFFVTKKFTTIPPPVTEVENGNQEIPLNSPEDESTVRQLDKEEASKARRISTSSLVQMTVLVSRIGENTTEKTNQNFEGLVTISPFFCLATLFFAAALRPSVPGGFYFLIFLLSGSYWATYRSLNRGFARLMRFVMIIIVMHIIFIVAYQTPWMQQRVDHKTLESRLLGLEPLITSSCAKDIRIIVYNYEYKLDSFLSPIFILLAYYTLAVSSVNLLKPRLVRSTPNRVRNNRASSFFGGRVSNVSDIAMQPLGSNQPQSEDFDPSIIDQISYGIYSVGSFIYQNSYIFTNILMMAWSIIFHSWLTFVFLLWANVLWMIPNQRKAMMQTSPFIVIYAVLLLTAQYIYGMDLNNDELPSKVNTVGINLGQIGLKRPQEHGRQPCVPLFIKTSFLLMFWVTLRQLCKEKSGNFEGNPEMMGPLQLSRSSQPTESPSRPSTRKKTSKFLKKFGEIIKKLLVRLWIWLLVLVIFVCAIVGERMTGFRICYMALFLFFLLVFQSSSKAWLNVMYGFWLFLIFYAMSILILIYTYQFDKFNQYWEDYLNISETLQSDIGLERFKTKDLLLNLLSPTMIVILTVIQVHYFHKRFIESLSSHRGIVAKDRLPRRSSVSQTNLRMSVAEQVNEDSFEESLKDLFRVFFKKIKNQSKRLFKNFKGVFWRFLELHIIKIVYITAFVCSIKEVCVLHIPFVFFCAFGLITKMNFQIFLSRIISFVVSLIVLAKMIYQVTYLDHNRYYVNCSGIDINVPYDSNDAVWFGLQKASEDTDGLMALLRRYIIYMVVATLHAVVILRQNQMRVMEGKLMEPLPKVLFPNIKRRDAEKNLEGMVKYIFNYGFYKIGFEITLITLAITIAYRQDIVAVVYVFWLFVLLLFGREKCRRIWSIFQMFSVFSIIIQYVLFVGLPPSMCMKYPWETMVYSGGIQIWGLLPGNMRIDHAHKLVFDFILLLMINRQKHVFNIESRFEQSNDYPGGSNKSVVEDIANLNQVRFQNPTRDFLSNIRNYLDIFKNGIFCGFYWITLAVVFLAGTNISDLLALGYLVGAFIFLWQGSDFYLRPIHTILKRWNWLIAYNVANIVIKTCLQIAGCMFLEQLTNNCCWLVHLLGISCAGNPINTNSVTEQISKCPDITTPVALTWDTVCFAFLIFQLRIFKSHYFCHIINDTQANSILASRGAELIEDLRQKQIEHRQEHEKTVLYKIKRKMEKIRATQQKMLRPIDGSLQYDEYGYPAPGSRIPKRKDIKFHPQAVRAGDYYMFEDMDAKFELDLIEDEVDFLADKIGEDEKKLARRKVQDDKVRDQPSTSKHSETMEKPVEEKPKDDSESADLTKDSDDQDMDSQISDEEITSNPVVRLLEGFLVSMTIRLNRCSRNYRYVNKILKEEKKVLKESRNFMRLSRFLSTGVFIKNTSSLENENGDNSSFSYASTTSNAPQSPLSNVDNATNIQTPLYTSPYNNNISNTQLTTTANSSNMPPFEPTSSTPPQPHDPQHVVDSDITEIPLDSVDAKKTRNEETEPPDQSTSRSAHNFDLEEDFTSRDHNIMIEIMVAAWYAILANTDIICYIVVFMNMVVNASLLSLPLPIMVFLWGTLSLPRPTKTFWVTLIAYTQAVVLIKCIFQYKLIWANYNHIPNQPLALEKIIGVELNPHYASYDLLLLIVLFLHRFILKSQGLWKSEYKDEILENDRGDEEANRNEDNATMVPSQSQNTDNDTTQQSEVSIETDEYVQGMSKLQRSKYFSSLRKFFFNLLKKTRLPTDVYAMMFLCDFINFFVLLFGFTAFGSQQDGGVQEYLAENKVPVPFLILLLLQFLLLVIDRALYLRKALFYKICFHFTLVIGIHICMFFVVPAVTERSFYSLTPPIVFYFIKCFYLLFSSYQIKCGYPKRILGNFLTRSFSMPNMISFKVYMLIPFAYDLRTILDWVCTDTTMTLFDWLKMEDIFANIFFIKCSRQMETDFPAIRAQKKVFYTKLIMGGTIILLIVICIWGPLCIFALGNAVGHSNVPYEASVSIRVGPYDPIYQTNNRESIYTFNDEMYATMQNAFLKNKGAITFISSYEDPADIAAIRLAGNSPSLWTISPPDKERLLNDLENSVPLTARFTYELTRIPPDKRSTGIVHSEITFTIDNTFEDKEKMVNMLKGTGEKDVEVKLYNIVPKFVKVSNTGDMDIVKALMPPNEGYRPLVIKMKTNEAKEIWWEIHEYCNDTYIEKGYNNFYTNVLSKMPFWKCGSGIIIYTFNDKKFPSQFNFLTAGGIIGVYTTFVLVASRVLKSFIGGQTNKIMYEDLPYVDRVLQLCLDIYLVREALEFELEEDLFAKLLFLYRSPETMIKWTRPKEEMLIGEGVDTESLLSRSMRRQEQL